MVADRARKERVERVEVLVGRDAEVAFDRLAHDGALLARDLEQILRFVADHFALEAGVEIVLGDPTLRAGGVAQLDVADC